MKADVKGVSFTGGVTTFTLVVEAVHDEDHMALMAAGRDRVPVEIALVPPSKGDRP